MSKPTTSPTNTKILDFKELKQAVERRFNFLKLHPMYNTAIDRDRTWQVYLSAFPEGTNPRYRERTEYDCNACKSFLRKIGGLVAIIDGEVATLWDLEIGGQFQPVVEALHAYVSSLPIDNVYLHNEPTVGTDKEHAWLDDKKKDQIVWHHFHLRLPQALVAAKDQIGPRLSEYQAAHDVVFRSLSEIKPDAVQLVQELIGQNLLYRGAEKKKLVDTFSTMLAEFNKLHTQRARDLFAWRQVLGPNQWVCKIRNDVIGTLLVDLSEGVDLTAAVASFENKVSGTNYKRTTALITPKMREAAKQELEKLGLMPALDRRYARLEDLSIRNLLFADRNIRKKLDATVFDELPVKAQAAPNLDRVEEVPIAKFLADILPTVKSMEIMVENKHVSNLVSLIAPLDLTAPTLFKWDNPFSWTYNGDVADSIKERVKAAGGNVTGDVCCRLAWFNHDDLDLHMSEPNGGEIYYARKISPYTGGHLDVDMNVTPTTREPVENIVYSSRHKMVVGTYKLYVNQFKSRESVDTGFEVEIDVQGTVHKFHYEKGMRTGQNVHVANLEVTKEGIKVIPSLACNSSTRTQNVWGLNTGSFYPVTAVMTSPNYWGEQGIGNKHFFFMIDGCKNDGSARGFYNEFLKGELEPHRKTMELVGARMRAEESDEQLSGLGFSDTKRADVVVRVQGAFTRTLKLVF